MTERRTVTVTWASGTRSVPDTALAPEPSLPPGVLVAGRYRIDRRLGEGRVGPVVLARSSQGDEPVAIKFMRRPAEGGDDGATWFLREARSAARIDSEFVARVSESGTLDGAPYLVGEYLDGPTFAALFEQRRRLPVQLVVSYALQAAEGLAEAHALGIVHRDIKPSNLFLVRRGVESSPRVRLADFGISNSVYPPGESMEVDGAARPRFGSPRWMPPEQIRSSGDADRRSDLWSLGAVLYEALAGVSPFGEGPTPELCARVLNDAPTPLRALRSDVPETLEAAVMQCLEKDPRYRFKNAAALARALAVGGTPGVRKAADRISRIGARHDTHDHEGVLEDSTPAGSAFALVPDVSLTQTGYGRAVEGIERIVRGSSEPPSDTVVEGEPVVRLPGGGHAPVGREPAREPLVGEREVWTTRPTTHAGFGPTPTPSSFVTPQPRPRLRRLAVMPLLVAGAAAAVGLTIFVADRLRDDDAPAADSAEPAAAPPPSASVPGATSPPLPPAATSATAPPAVEAPAPSSPSPELSAHAAPVPTHPAAPHPRERAKTPPTSPDVAPIGTGGFGGRE
jgi:serine/threonine-protein kinase